MIAWGNLATLHNGDVLISLRRVDVRSIGRYTEYAHMYSVSNYDIRTYEPKTRDGW